MRKSDKSNGVTAGAERSQTRDVLRGIWLFSELTETEVDELTKIATRRRYAERAVIFRQADPDTDLYAVVKGNLKVSTSGKEGRELVLSLIGPSQVFGEIALLDRKPRSATVTALSACELIVIRQADFTRMLLRQPSIATKLLETLAQLVRRLSERAEDSAFLDVRTRLAKKLLDLSAHHSTRVGPNQFILQVKLSQQELGDMVQATRESVNKCLRDWMRQGVIERTSSRLVIQDRRRLQALAGV